MSPASGVSKRNLGTKLIERCWEDPAFKAELLTDPKAKFEEFLGHTLPADLKVTIHEDDAHTLNLTLPYEPPYAKVSGELSDAALDQIAGGDSWWGSELPESRYRSIHKM